MKLGTYVLIAPKVNYESVSTNFTSKNPKSKNKLVLNNHKASESRESKNYLKLCSYVVIQSVNLLLQNFIGLVQTPLFLQ